MKLTYPLLFATSLCFVWAADAQDFTLQKGDHICIVGNTLAERMQHDGWLETLIHARFPDHELVFRNLGYSGDEIDGWQNFNHRLRSMDFGSHDQWLSGIAPCPQPKKLSPRDSDKVRENRFELTNTRADVVFAFYGYNESFEGEAGLPAFRQNVAAFIRHTLEQKHNGKSAPRLVLFSPIPHEVLNDPNLPSKEAVEAANSRLKLYSQALSDVAKEHGVKFVDLMTAGLELFRHAPAVDARMVIGDDKRVLAGPYTINGVHLNEAGARRIAIIADTALFSGTDSKPSSGASFQLHPTLRAAVLDKNFYWYHRYRVTDGFSTYGDRAFLKFSEGAGGYGDGLSNYSVGQRELDVLDTLTSNRDKVVWAAAQGKSVKPDDRNLPEFIPVITNKPGPLEGGKHLFLSGQDAVSKMTVHKNMKVQLFADESMFPELVKPVQMSFDTKGRLWVACWRTYPHWKPTEKMDDRLLILEDTNGDGRADVCKTFAGDLHNPTGFEFWNGGVIVAQGPDVLFLKDTDGDDKYDIKERMIHGFDTADTHHTINSFVLDPGGAIYMQEGTFHHSQIETPWGPPRRLANGGVFRYEPRTQKTDIYVTFGFANPHGHAFDSWGQDIVVDGTGANPFHGPLFSSRLDFPNKHNRPAQVYQQRTRPCSAIEILSSSHFPEEHRGNLLVANVIGFQGILQYKLHGSNKSPASQSANTPNGDEGFDAKDAGSSLGATEVEPIVFSSDPNFRPGDIEVGPDGAIYFTDWQNPIIGHMQHNLRDPSRDHDHGRVYRVIYEGRNLLQPKPVFGQPIDKLLGLLTDPDDRVRYRARIELSGRPTGEVIEATVKWLKEIEDPEMWQRVSEPWRLAAADHARLEALWLYQSHNVINTELLESVLTSKSSDARSAAVRVIGSWHDRLPQALDLLRRAAADPSPRVRLMAIWSASFLSDPIAAEVIFIAQEQPQDSHLEFLGKEALRTLQPQLDKVLKGGQRVAFKSDAGARYLLKSLSNDELIKEPHSRLVLAEMLYRPGLSDQHRREAVRELARLENTAELRMIIDAISALDSPGAMGTLRAPANVDTGVVFDLVRLLVGRTSTELNSARAELEKLAVTARQPIFRQIGYVSLINVDQNVETAWALAIQDPRRLVDFVSAMPLISDPGVRATLYDRVERLLTELPEALRGPQSKGTHGRFVRVELHGRGTLTLAEVEVLSGGDNVARRGRATQKNTAHGGEASRGIDGNKSGTYGDGGQTHTQENTPDPYWEVDLGDEYPIDQIVIYNRTEIPDRLNNFTLKVLDEQRSEVFRKDKNPAPAQKVIFEVGGGGAEALIRRAAMNALTYVRGQESRTFATLSRFVKNDTERAAAIRSLQRLPQTSWPKDDAVPLLNVLTAAVQKIPAADRTSGMALDSLEFSDALTTLLPGEEARKYRAVLSELGVRVIKVGTIFEKMSYDKDVVVVKASKPVEFLLENSDLMPHNFVIVQPGSLEEIGMLSEAQAQQPGFAEQHYVPRSNKVLAKSALLQPRESQRLSFTAPSKPGVYPYVCTYPGHWRRMYGAMYVVEDLDAYLEAPEAYLSSSKVQAVDPLLKDRRPRTEWKLDDLESAVVDMAKLQGRSYANGKQLFTIANCVGCHKLDGLGRELGPDLTKLDAKWTTVDVLKEILDPSLKINEKYQSNVIELGSGKVITGLVVEETPDIIRLIENPLVKADPIVIKRGDIVERQKSKTSLMPKGLLDKLTRDEILDLIAYVSARGDRKHELFHAADHEHK